MNDLNYVFWGLTWDSMLLIAGRFFLMVSAALLVLKHATWFARGYHTERERRARARWRATIEMIVGAVVAALYAQQLYFDHSVLNLDRWESAVQVWAFVGLFVGLLLTRGETQPPPLE